VRRIVDLFQLPRLQEAVAVDEHTIWEKYRDLACPYCRMVQKRVFFLMAMDVMPGMLRTGRFARIEAVVCLACGRDIKGALGLTDSPCPHCGASDWDFNPEGDLGHAHAVCRECGHFRARD
jgi:DNA-directed RNA polymerase subunit RPC12/RpoP